MTNDPQRSAPPTYAERVLLVEDAEEDVQLFRRLLGRARPQTALDIITEGETAIRWLTEKLAEADAGRRVLPQAIFLDLRLPGMSGLEVLRWIRSQPAFDRSLVAVCTGSTADTDNAEAQRLGANAFLVKHPTADRLGSLLASAEAAGRAGGAGRA